MDPLEVQHENQQLSLLNSAWRISADDRKQGIMRRTSWKCAQVLRRRFRGGKHPIPMASRRTPRPGSTNPIGADREPLALWSDGTGDPKNQGIGAVTTACQRRCQWAHRPTGAYPRHPRWGKQSRYVGAVQRLGTPSVRTIERGRFEWGASQIRGSG